MTRVERHRQKKKYFGKLYLVYVLLLIAVCIAVFFFVRGQMIEYENGVSDNYVINLVKDVRIDSELGKYLEEHNFSDTRFGDAEKRKSDFYTKAASASIEAKASSLSRGTSNPVYDISADGKPFITISLKESGSHTILAIMTLSEWEIEYAILRDSNSDEELVLSDNNNLDYSLVIPEGFTVYVDGKECGVEASEERVLEYFEYVAPYVDAPKGYVYELNDLYFEPSITVVNNGGEQLTLEKQSDSVLIAPAEYVATPQAKELADSVCNPLYIGELWSKFMTDDIGGYYHGLDTVRYSCMLLNETNLYTLATKWATGPDIAFVSHHYLNGFSNENVDNYVQYNENLFSCDVYFEKNMQIIGGGPRTDIFSNRMYFGNVDGRWYLIDMVTMEHEQ